MIHTYLGSYLDFYFIFEMLPKLTVFNLNIKFDAQEQCIIPAIDVKIEVDLQLLLVLGTKGCS